MLSRLLNIFISITLLVTLVFGITYRAEPKLMDPDALKALGQKIEFVSNSIAIHHGPCDDPRFEVKPRMGGEKVRRRMIALIKCAIDRWSVPGGVQKALDVAYCESGDNLWPWAGYMGSLGVFQQNGKYWQSRVNTYLKPRWFPGSWNAIHEVPQGAYNARANVLVSIQMAHHGGWSPWSCA